MTAVTALFDRFTFTGLANLPPLWAIAAAGGLVLLLYILKLRRREVEISFSKLWARVLRDREPTSFWRQLKRILSLLLQVLLIAILLGAISDPRDKAELKKGRHILILVDTSASMQARDCPPRKGEEAQGLRSRIEVAKAEVRKLILSKRRNDYMMLVRMDGQVTPVTNWTRDGATLEKAMGALAAAETAADIGRGLRFAADTLRDARQPMLILIGDGQYDQDQLRCVFWGRKPPKGFNCEQGEDAPTKVRIKKPKPMAPPAMAPAPMARARRARRRGRRRRKPKPEEILKRLKAPRPEVVAAERFIDPIAMGEIPMFAVMVGKSSNNLGIIAFNARRNPADKFNHQLFVKVKNYRKKRARVNLLISTGAVLPDKIYLDIGPGETRQHIKKELPAATTRVTGTLAPVSGRGKLDDFSLDDKAYALLPKRRKSKVLLISKGHLNIEAVLLLDENITYKRIMPAAWVPSLAKKYDAVIFDDFTPERIPRAGNFLVFDPRGKAFPIEVAKRVKDPEIWWPQGDKDKRHRIMDYIRVKDMRAVESAVFKLQRGDVPLIRLDERGDVYAVLRKEPGRRLVAVGFSAHQTNWVVRIGFPVFILNTIAYFAGENTRLIHTYRTGETWQIPLDVPGDTATVTDPRKKKFKAPLKDGKVTFYGRHIGYHTLTAAGKSVQIAANLANPRESDVTPRKELVLGYGKKFSRKPKTPNLEADEKTKTISARTVLLAVLLAGIGLVLLGFGLYGGRAAPLWVFLGITLLAAAVVVTTFALELRPWMGLLLAVAAILLVEWLTYNRRVTV